MATLRAARLQEGRVLLEERRWREAADYFRALAGAKAGLPEPQYWLGVALVELGEIAEAADAFAAATTWPAGARLAHLKRGLALERLRRREEAIAAFRAALDLAPDWGPANLGLARVLLAVGRPADAIAAARTCLARAPDDTAALRIIGVANFRLRRFAEAADSFRALRRASEDTTGISFDLGRALYHAGDIERAMTAFDRALRQGADYRVRIYVARHFVRSDQARRAEPLLRQACLIQPNNRTLATLLARLLVDIGQPDAARNILEGLRGAPTRSRRIVGAMALAAGGRVARAIEQFQELVAEAPDDPEARLHLGNALMRKRRFGEAEEMFRGLMAFRPDAPEAYRRMAACMLAEQRPDEAVDVLQAALRLEPRHVPTLVQLARAHLALDAHDHAQAVLAEAAAIEPDNRWVAAMLGRFGGSDADGAVAGVDPGQSDVFRLRQVADGGGQSLLDSFYYQVQSVRALALRDLRAEYAHRTLGYFWAFVEPLAMLIMLWFIRKYMRGFQAADMSIEAFILAGVGVWLCYMRCSKSLSSALRQNRALLNYPHIAPLAPRLSRLYTAYINNMVVLVLFGFAMSFVGFDIPLENLPQTIAATVVAALIGAALGIVQEALSPYSAGVQLFFSVFNRFLFLTSGIFFSADELPEKVRQLLWYNPLLHLVDLARNGLLQRFPIEGTVFWYPILMALLLLVFALMLDTIVPKKVLEK